MSLRFQQNLSLQKQQVEFEERTEKTLKLLHHVAAPIENDFRWTLSWGDPFTESLNRIQNHPMLEPELVPERSGKLSRSGSAKRPISSASGKRPVSTGSFYSLEAGGSSSSTNLAKSSITAIRVGTLTNSRSMGNGVSMVAKPKLASFWSNNIAVATSEADAILQHDNDYYYPPLSISSVCCKKGPGDQQPLDDYAVNVIPNLTRNNSSLYSPNVRIKDSDSRQIQRFPSTSSKINWIKSEAEREMTLRKLASTGNGETAAASGSSVFKMYRKFRFGEQ